MSNLNWHTHRDRGERCDGQSEQIRYNRYIQKEIEHLEMLRELARRRQQELTEVSGDPSCPVLFTVVMMHRAAGPLLSLKLYEATSPCILLQ